MNQAIRISNLLPGFSDPVLDSQRTFRQLLNAMAHPGKVTHLNVSLQAPWPLQSATAAVCLTLLDLETPLWVDFDKNSDVARWLRFHCGCPLADSFSSARFALIFKADRVPALTLFNIGQDEFPEQSTTLIIQVSGIVSGSGCCLRGPGIETFCMLDVQGLPNDFWKAWQSNHLLYPLGVDIVFTTGSILVALPRTIEVEE